MKAIAGALAVSLLGVSCATVPVKPRAQAIALDFTASDSGVVPFQRLPRLSTGHTIMSAIGMRIDTKGPTLHIPVPGFTDSDAVSTIFLDSGRTVVFLNAKTKTYTQFNPLEMIDNFQKMMFGMGVIMDIAFTGDPKVEDIGAGPLILGYKTEHYRITTGMKTTITFMGRRATSETWNVSDEYIAPDLDRTPDPSRNAAPMTNGSGNLNKLYLEAMKRLRAKLGKGMQLRDDVLSTTTDSRGTRSTRTIHEITRIETTTASNDLFQIPAGFTKVDFPLAFGGAGIPSH